MNNIFSLILMNCVACDSECVANANYCHICGINLRLQVVSRVLHATFKKEIVDATFVERLSIIFIMVIRRMLLLAC